MPVVVGFSTVVGAEMDVTPSPKCQVSNPPAWDPLLQAGEDSTNVPVTCPPCPSLLPTHAAVPCWDPSLPQDHAIPETIRSLVPFRPSAQLAASPRLQLSQPQKAKFPPCGLVGGGRGSVPMLNNRKERLVSSSVSQYFTELCFPYLVQLKSRGEVLYKSKFF